MKNVRIYQIYYSEQTKAELDPGFIPLDNLANERPDWREYWPIRKFLLANKLEPDGYYGFLSPKFRLKTGLAANAVHGFIGGRPGDADIYVFSPMVDLSAFFLNVFEQGELFIPGLTDASQKFFDEIGVKVDLKGIITDTRDTVFSNFFVANAKYWSEWFEMTEKLFAICEGKDGRLKRKLTVETPHDRAQVKVFLMERIATLLLCLRPEFRVRAYCPFDLPMSPLPKLAVRGREALICDALKIAYRQQNHRHYLNAFNAIRNEVLSKGL